MSVSEGIRQPVLTIWIIPQAGGSICEQRLHLKFPRVWFLAHRWSVVAVSKFVTRKNHLTQFFPFRLDFCLSEAGVFPNYQPCQGPGSCSSVCMMKQSLIWRRWLDSLRENTDWIACPISTMQRREKSNVDVYVCVWGGEGESKITHCRLLIVFFSFFFFF